MGSSFGAWDLRRRVLIRELFRATLISTLLNARSNSLRTSRRRFVDRNVMCAALAVGYGIKAAA